jgi:hypothetical protein
MKSNDAQIEPELSVFDRGLLDQFDNTLAAIHRISKGTCGHVLPHRTSY